jgi:hypothetical protein
MMKVVVSEEAAAIPGAAHLAVANSAAIPQVCQMLCLEGVHLGAGQAAVEEASSVSAVPVSAEEAVSA